MQASTLRGILFVLLVLFASLYFYTDDQEKYYQGTALPATKALLTTISTWDKQILLDNLAPEAKQTLSDQQLDKLLSHYRKFGRFKSAEQLVFSRLASALSLFGQRRVNYSGTALFENSPTTVNITLSDTPNGFVIYNFSIAEL